jgi:ribosomal protein S18 acetylase RimI-like enzyme
VSLAVGERVLRALRPADRSRVEEMTRAVGLFWDYEIPIALEVFDDSTGANPAGAVDPDYESLGVEIDSALAGWAIWGPRPGEEGTFDLYWIVVDRATQGRGVGSALVEEMERRIAGRASRLVVETSGRPDYEPTRGFYRRHGFRQVGRTADHYAPGDDQVEFEKRY